jgi:hypothetical protein
MTRLIHVAVFEDPGKRKIKLRAYTKWFSPSMTGCCLHHIHCETSEAKGKAMAEHRAKCMGGRK